MAICASMASSATAAAHHPPGSVPSGPVLDGAVELLKALASAARLGIVLELAHGERCVHELVEITGLTQPLVSQHLRVLRGAGVVTTHRRGREIAYSLSDDHLAHIAADAVRHSE